MDRRRAEAKQLAAENPAASGAGVPAQPDGSVVVYDDGIALTGSQVLEQRRTHPGWHPQTDLVFDFHDRPRMIPESGAPTMGPGRRFGKAVGRDRLTGPAGGTGR